MSGRYWGRVIGRAINHENLRWQHRENRSARNGYNRSPNVSSALFYAPLIFHSHALKMASTGAEDATVLAVLKLYQLALIQRMSPRVRLTGPIKPCLEYG